MAFAPTFPERLRAAAARTALDQSDIAYLVGANPRTVARWLAEGGAAPRTDVRRRALEVIAVLEQLSGVLTPQAAHDWLYSPNAALGHDKPIDLLADGQWRKVLGMISAMGEGVFV
jgi:uncharacterized protein (DUF2384 family)